jgi:hypothetical protein
MQEIEYREVEGFPAYRVGSDGSVWSRWRKGPGAKLSNTTWLQLRATPDRDGYRRVQLSHANGTKLTRKVCVLVAEAFLGPRPEGMECRHDNGRCADDRADNLIWGTSLENAADKRRHGTIAKGERHGKAKLTATQIEELLALKGQVIQQVAADRFGCSRGYVGQLWSGARSRVPT